MEFKNHTPFPAISWENVDAKRRWHITTMLRVKYIFHPSEKEGEWELRLTPEQEELFGEDIYYNDDTNKPVRYETDFISYKPNTDIILNSKARISRESPEKEWFCGLTITDKAETLLKSVTLKVCGAHQWKKNTDKNWVKTPVKKTNEVGICYDKAFGGSIVNPDLTEKEKANNGSSISYLAYDKNNPVGTGIQHPDMPETPFPAAQVSWQDKALDDKKYPAGFGFINRAWQPRLSYAGTYDDEWLEEQHPYPPHDFDYFHNQAANPALILDGFIQSGTVFDLVNLLSPKKNSFKIPELHCFTEIYLPTGEMIRKLMNIDTVLIDIEDDDPKQWAVYLSYRHHSLKGVNPKEINVRYLPVEILANMKRKKQEELKKEEDHGG